MAQRYINTKIESKNTILFTILTEVFGEKMNLVRIKFFGLFICALCKVQTVCFEKLAVSFDTDVRVDSSLRRIQRFMSDYLLDTDIIARLVFSLLHHKPPYRLAMDRTNWKFGSTNINILVIAIVYQGIAFPILFRMMPKFGNSSTDAFSFVNPLGHNLSTRTRNPSSADDFSYTLLIFKSILPVCFNKLKQLHRQSVCSITSF